MTRMSILDAAELARKSYLGRAELPPVRKELNKHGVQAFLLTNNTLVIPGTNEASDWTDFNLKIFETNGVKPAMDDVGKLFGNTIWHAGFRAHAREILEFMGSLKPSYIIGHSLGAASAQILGSIWKVPTVCFASPMPRRGKAKLTGAGWVINFVRNDDMVCRMPPKNFGFRRVGSVEVMHPTANHQGGDHAMPHYIDAIHIELASGGIPTHWPR